jgi:metal-responsive CopG/Arc/MetJ family transcriptional regulator
VPEKQVLFRVEAKLLDALDKKLAKDGYSTRNAWFKDAVSSYAGKGGSAKAGKKRR